MLPLEAPPAPPLSALAPGVAAGRDPDNGGGDSSSSHDTDLSADQEPAQSRGLPGPLGGDLLGALSGEQSLGCGDLLRALFHL